MGTAVRLERGASVTSAEFPKVTRSSICEGRGAMASRHLVRRYLTIAFVSSALSGCTFHCPGCHVSQITPRPDGEPNLFIITQFNCPMGRFCTYKQGPTVWVNGNELELRAACSERVCEDGHGSITELSVANKQVIVDVLGSSVPPRWIVDFEVEISQTEVYVWIAEAGRNIQIVPRELACKGEGSGYQRKFPRPGTCDV